MNVKKFTAPTSREALRKVRDALGPDAVILSNRPVDGVVEILALANDDVASMAAPAHETEMAQPKPSLSLPPENYANRRAPAVHSAPAAPEPAFDMSLMASQMSSMMQQALVQAQAQAQEAAAAEMSGMMHEIRAMRGLMETQLAEISWGTTQQREPQKNAVLREMLAAGFSASLSRYLIEKLPSGKDEAQSMAWIKTVLSRNLQTISNEDAILENGGVFALVGPTGVGKTTSTAKLAARCVMRHGPEKLALITTDAYRIGGHEQLRIYGKILGVMVHSVKDESDLRIALKELRNKHTVLIDTVGVSQRDHNVAEQVAMLSESGADVKRLLCLNSTSTNETLNEVVRAYQGSGLAGCIMTKLDEAASMGNVLDVVIRQKLNLHYISNGQRVPEDLHLPDRAMLIDRAFRLKKDAASQFADSDLPLVMSGAATASNDRTLREVYLG
ncbi:flagellar biosynthesis protein FlhF [Massilia sp. PAMC28688]|uniref:flagellar biosynthesis protein FlhF n=1 Tax=Massilia sp. PAMC28688 TaxID=2861283 RepID=UPI001C62DCE6|nr:flagellar biosynthesis protein FlhF [Massilia sp. PAMC28688]QYF91995.1 flagellar biosynthesis protein FlhF [Massilia sp. PAMC28688]